MDAYSISKALGSFMKVFVPIFAVIKNKMHGRSQQIKIVTLGDGRVGKTSLSLRFVRNEFNEFQERTVQASYLEKEMTVNGISLTVNIWDTAG
jgi:GTPase SAR1 family protein